MRTCFFWCGEIGELSCLDSASGESLFTGVLLASLSLVEKWHSVGELVLGLVWSIFVDEEQKGRAV